MSRPIAPHVAQAIGAVQRASAGRTAQPSAPRKPGMAPHVAAAVSRPAVQPSPAPHGARPVAPHVQRALAATAPRPPAAHVRTATAPPPPSPKGAPPARPSPVAPRTAQPALASPVRPPVASHVARALGRNGGTLQPFGWAIHDSRDMDHSDVVDENLRRATGRYSGVETTTDPDKEDDPWQPILQDGEVIHIHAHGHPENVGGFGAPGMARELVRKFQAQGLNGRTIVFHSCEVGQGNFLENLLTNLEREAQNRGVKLIGTRAFAPTNFLVVNSDGRSFVAKENALASAMREESTRGSSLRQYGKGWKAWEIYDDGYYRTIREITSNVDAKIEEILDDLQETRDIQYYDAPEREISNWEMYGETFEDARANLDWIAAETSDTPFKTEDKLGNVFDSLIRVKLQA